jgi:type IV secretory pathway VirB6-like protein
VQKLCFDHMNYVHTVVVLAAVGSDKVHIADYLGLSVIVQEASTFQPSLFAR